MFDNNRLKQRRLDMGLTLEEVGRVVGISRSAVQKHEKGIIKNVYISTVELFSKALRCSPAYLMCWTDEPLSSNSDSEHKIVNQYNKLSAIDQVKVTAFIEGLLSSDSYSNKITMESDIVNTIEKGESLSMKASANTK